MWKGFRKISFHHRKIYQFLIYYHIQSARRDLRFAEDAPLAGYGFKAQDRVYNFFWLPSKSKKGLLRVVPSQDHLSAELLPTVHTRHWDISCQTATLVGHKTPWSALLRRLELLNSHLWQLWSISLLSFEFTIDFSFFFSILFLMDNSDGEKSSQLLQFSFQLIWKMRFFVV